MIIAVAVLASLLLVQDCEADFSLQEADGEHPSYLIIQEHAAGLLMAGTDAIILIPAEVYPDGYSLELSSGIQVGFRSRPCSSGEAWEASGYPTRKQFRCKQIGDAPIEARKAFAAMGVTFVSWETSQPSVFAGFSRDGALVAIQATDELANGSAAELETWRVEPAGVARIRTVLLGCSVTNLGQGS